MTSIGDNMAAEFLPITAIKFGGCLLTDKAAYKKVDRNKIVELGQELSALIARGVVKTDRTVIIFGGGSYGNMVPKRYNLVPRTHSTNTKDLSRMSLSQVELATEVIDAWRECGVPLQYFHFPSLLLNISSDDVYKYRLNTVPISLSLTAGLMPVLMGDLIVGGDGSTSIVSSDVVPILLSNSLALARNIYVTNVPGVMTPLDGVQKTIPRLHKSSLGAMEHAWYSAVGDLTGGMKLKVDCSLELSRRGITTEIIDGTVKGSLEALLVQNDVLGTTVVGELPIVRDEALRSSTMPARLENHFSAALG